MPSTPPARLVLLPGLICSEIVWAAQVAALADFQPVALHGYGDARSFVTMARRVLDAVPGPMSLAGHSMGARVALEVFRLAPARVDRLALLDTGVHPLAPGEAGKRRALLELGQREGMQALVDAWLPPMVSAARRRDPAFMAPLNRMCLEAGIRQFENQVIALVERPEVRSLLPQIECPVLVGVGSEDAWAPIEQHRDIAAAIPGATLDVYEGAGHMSPVEAPQQVTASLRRWLNRPK